MKQTFKILALSSMILLASCSKYDASEEKLIESLMILLSSEACGKTVDENFASFSIQITARIVDTSTADFMKDLEDPKRIKNIARLLDEDLTAMCIRLENTIRPIYIDLYQRYAK